MPITYLDEQPTSKITYLDEPKGKSLRKGVWGSVTEEEFERGGGNPMRNAERAGAMSREAIRANRYKALLGPLAFATGGNRAVAAGINPALSPTFQEETLANLTPSRGLIPTEGKGILGKMAMGVNTLANVPASALGMVEDFVTDPVQISLAVITGGLSKAPMAIKAGKALGATKAGKSLKAVATTPITKEMVAKPFVKAGQVAKGISKIPEKVGEGATRALITSQATADRGLAKGFAPMLKSEYFGERIPQDVVKRGTEMFTNARNVSGEEISNIVKTKYIDNYVDAKVLQDEAKSILGKGISIDDLDISPAQKKLLNRETEKVLGIKGKEFTQGITQKEMVQTFRKEKPLSVPDLWEMRKGLDKVMYENNWKPDAINYLKKLRRILNNPIRGAGDDIAKSFDRYATIENIYDKIGSKFKGIVNRETGETFSPEFANLIEKELMGDTPKSAELRAMVSQIDPAFAEELFNISGARQLHTRIPSPVSGVQNLVLYPMRATLRPKNVATAISKFQKKPISLKARNP